MVAWLVTDKVSFIFNDLNKNIQERQIKKENVKELTIAILQKAKRISQWHLGRSLMKIRNGQKLSFALPLSSLISSLQSSVCRERNQQRKQSSPKLTSYEFFIKKKKVLFYKVAIF